jgi:hypothetical protein
MTGITVDVAAAASTTTIIKQTNHFQREVESQIQHGEKPADSVNPENALIEKAKENWLRFADTQS